MATLSTHCNLSSLSNDHRKLFELLLSNRRTKRSNFLRRRCGGGERNRSFTLNLASTSRIYSQSDTVQMSSTAEELQVRKCAPLLENGLLSSNKNMVDTKDWKTIPDIWTHAAERFGDKIAVTDPYHDPPTKMTYKQLKLEILEFCEGLRVVGLKPEEKLALFADNSCRWLVADQGHNNYERLQRVKDAGITGSVVANMYAYIAKRKINISPQKVDALVNLASEERCDGDTILCDPAPFGISLYPMHQHIWTHFYGVPVQGIMATGAINVVRGTRSSVDELLQIYTHSESVALVVDSPELFNRISESFISRAAMRFVVLLWGDKSSLSGKVPEGLAVFSYKELIDLGQESRRVLPNSPEKGCHHIYEAIKSDDVATLVYTSGTTGNPKGVMLTHQNLLHQINNLGDIVPANTDDRFLSMLPPWHAYERAAEYFTFAHGVEQIYTIVKNLKEDLQRYQPHYIISVPLVYETLYSGIQKQISRSSAARKLIALTLIKISMTYMEMKRIYEGRFLTSNPKQRSVLISMIDCLWARILATLLWPLHMLGKKLVYQKIHSAIGISKAGISGGGSLPLHVDRFYEAIGVNLQNGYGLTESSPVVAARKLSCNVLGTIGHPLKHTEIKVVDPETGDVLPAGSKGIVKVRGPQVMKGYYKNPSATKEALDEEGWLSTGDIGWIAPIHSRGRSRNCGGMIVLEGRSKDTIVLTTGENVEPSELEEAAMRSKLIQQIVVVGQDQRRLGAVIVANKEEILAVAKELCLSDDEANNLSKAKITNLLQEELRTWTSQCSFQIGPILVVDEPFTIDSGLMTPTMKIRRDRVVARYSDEIANLYK